MAKKKEIVYKELEFSMLEPHINGNYYYDYMFAYGDILDTHDYIKNKSGGKYILLPYSLIDDQGLASYLVLGYIFNNDQCFIKVYPPPLELPDDIETVEDFVKSTAMGDDIHLMKEVKPKDALSFFKLILDIEDSNTYLNYMTWDERLDRPVSFKATYNDLTEMFEEK